MKALLARAGIAPERFRELVAYGLATLVAFAVDLALLTLFVARLGIHYAVAAALSFVVAGVLLWMLCVRFVFRARRLSNRSLELSAFIGLGVVGLVVQTTVMVIAVDALDVHYLLAKLCAACCTFVVNFLLRRALLFSAPPGRGGDGPA